MPRFSPLPMSPQKRDAIVIGAGIVGTCTALYLQREGLRVTLIDRAQPGEACSFGNAARVAVGLYIPWSSPGLIWKVPGMLADRRHPLKVRPWQLIRAMPWFARFIQAGSAENSERIADGLKAIMVHALESYMTLMKPAGAEDLFERNGYLYAYKSLESRERTRFGFNLCRDRGIKIEEVDENRLREMEPALGRIATCGHYWPGEVHCINPLRLTQKLAEFFVRQGGHLVQANVLGFDMGADGPRHVITDSGPHSATHVVLAAGAWAKPLAKQWGVDLALEPEGGYHCVMPDPGFKLRRPLSLVDILLTCTPLETGLRVCNGAEFAGHDARPNPARKEVLLQGAREVFPTVNTEGASFWRGDRPSLPDSLPAIGRAPLYPHAYFACGHGHVGLTTAAITGRLIAELVMGRPPAVDLAPYRPDRF